MRNSTIWESTQLYSDNVILPGHNNPELYQRWLTRYRDMETQLLCDKDGEPIPGTPKYTKDGQEWGPVRWPWKAKTNDPEFKDYPKKFLFEDHLLAIGSSGWDWKNKCSRWLGYDFDTITGHAEGLGHSDADLERVAQNAPDFVDVIRSTRGKGKHLYVFFDDPCPVTQNHDEHAAVSRSILDIMSAQGGFDFGSKMDMCGRILWMWHVATTEENQGYAPLKKATRHLTASDVPPNWRDHLDVVTDKQRGKVRVRGWSPDGQLVEDTTIDDETSAYPKIQLDDCHKQFLSDLEDTGYTYYWVRDHHLAQTHTCAIKDVMEKWAKAGHPLKGTYDTNSEGVHPEQPNCVGGDTKVVTREGVKPICELAGRDVEIITAKGAWVMAPFKSYGEQEVFAVTLERRGRTKVIKATGDHRWFVCKYKTTERRKTKVNFGQRKEVTTNELDTDQILIQTKPQLNVIPSVVGIQHGLVWGDGTNGSSRIASSLSLFGEKDSALLKFFKGHPKRVITRSIGGVEVWNLPYHFKSLVPLHYDKPYLYGWLAGYFAADGCVATTGSCIIRSSDEKSIEHVRDVCHILGIETSPVTCRYVTNGYKPGNVFTTCIKAADLTEEFFLIPEHRRRFNSTTDRQHHYWRVVSVEPTGREEVFCCTVSGTGCFCLEDFILTGNCFMRPRLGGGWDVYRFSEGVVEHPLWDTINGKTHITLNIDPSLRQGALSAEGFECADPKNGFEFPDTESLHKALKLLGSKFQMPDTYVDDPERSFRLKTRPTDSRIILQVDRNKSDIKADWMGWEKKPGIWQCLLKDRVNTQQEEDRNNAYWDNKVRTLKSVSMDDTGGVAGEFECWMFKDKSGHWVRHPKDHIVTVISKETQSNAVNVVATAIENAWVRVNKPFEPEYPGGREWNYAAPQYAWEPRPLKEGEKPHHPHWDLVFNHCGSGLDKYVAELDWCREWGMTTGGDYLRAWVAAMMRYPYCRLPYLFMFSAENCTGKTTWHEIVGMLLRGGKGYGPADQALTSNGDFNGELNSVILGTVDETDISKAGGQVYNKIKDWSTAKKFSVHRKFKEPYLQPNFLHLVQTANVRTACPVSNGDSRITVIEVPIIKEHIAKETLELRCEEQGPDFMATLMSIHLPKHSDRMRVPVIETDAKEQAISDSRDELEIFLQDSCAYVPGEMIKFDEFYDTFIKSLSRHKRNEYDKATVKAGLPGHFPHGYYSKNIRYVGNLAIGNEVEPTDLEAKKFIVSGGKLILE